MKKHNNMNRRDFVTRAGLGTGSILLVPSFLTSCQNTSSGEIHALPNTTGGLISQALISDCSRLLLESGLLNDTFHVALKAGINEDLPGNMSRLGSLVPFGPGEVREALEGILAAADGNHVQRVKKVSLLLGAMMIAPFREEMKATRRKIQDDGIDIREFDGLIDHYMLDQLAANQHTGNADSRQMQQFFNMILPRMITRLHTLKPDYEDGPGWVVRMTQWRKKNQARMNDFGTSMSAESNKKMDKLIKKYHIYDSADQIIVRVRRMADSKNRGESAVVSINMEESIYARSLVMGYENVLSFQDSLPEYS